MPDVRSGQIWADNDKRAAGRQIRVNEVGSHIAVCTVVRDRDNKGVLKGRYNTPRPAGWTAIGTTTRISLHRFKPTSTGYRLVEEAQP